jgi:hypothetical protein
MRTRTNPSYGCWREMRRRCGNPNRKDYRYYGGRGISVCERWSSFRNFDEDMGPRPSLDHSIDRIDVNGDYEPGNCRWATSAVQIANRRPAKPGKSRGVGKAVTINGTRYSTMLEACAAVGISRFTVSSRLKRGLSTEDAFALPCGRSTAPQSVMVRGVRYESIASAAASLGVNYRTACNRLKAGEPPESALTRSPAHGWNWRNQG